MTYHYLRLFEGTAWQGIRFSSASIGCCWLSAARVKTIKQSLSPTFARSDVTSNRGDYQMRLLVCTPAIALHSQACPTKGQSSAPSSACYRQQAIWGPKTLPADGPGQKAPTLCGLSVRHKQPCTNAGFQYLQPNQQNHGRTVGMPESHQHPINTVCCPQTAIATLTRTMLLHRRGCHKELPPCTCLTQHLRHMPCTWCTPTQTRPHQHTQPYKTCYAPSQ
jgi:hypothetical protein